MFTVKLFNSSNCELDSKTGPDLAELLHAYADDGCLSGGDTLRLIDNEDA
jgi:hypothetical protein